VNPKSKIRASSEWVVHQLRGLHQPAPGVLGERRERPERRHRLWWAIACGSFISRRRAHRRDDETHLKIFDLQDSYLLGIAVCIMLLCVGDAFLTINLLARGAREANPIMASVVYTDVTYFTIIKMCLTSLGVAVMVFLARHRFMRVVNVETLLYLVLFGYVVLVGYELAMIEDLGGFGIF
jgi:Domain of unknown function (DUF5658)